MATGQGPAKVNNSKNWHPEKVKPKKIRDSGQGREKSISIHKFSSHKYGTSVGDDEENCVYN